MYSIVSPTYETKSVKRIKGWRGVFALSAQLSKQRLMLCFFYWWFLSFIYNPVGPRGSLPRRITLSSGHCQKNTKVILPEGDLIFKISKNWLLNVLTNTYNQQKLSAKFYKYWYWPLKGLFTAIRGVFWVILIQKVPPPTSIFGMRVRLGKTRLQECFQIYRPIYVSGPPIWSFTL